jgi:hypothetical protein
MYFTTIFATLLSIASWTVPVAASLRITAKHHSWGGVNYPMLQFFTPQHRDDTIRELVAANVRVIRLFSEYSHHVDPPCTYCLQSDPMHNTQMYGPNSSKQRIAVLTVDSPKVSLVVSTNQFWINSMIVWPQFITSPKVRQAMRFWPDIAKQEFQARSRSSSCLTTPTHFEEQTMCHVMRIVRSLVELSSTSTVWTNVCTRPLCGIKRFLTVTSPRPVQDTT